MKSRRRATKKSKSRSPKIPFFIRLSFGIIIVFIALATIIKIAEFLSLSNNDAIPKLEIHLADVPIEQIDSEEKSIVYPNNDVDITFNGKTFSYSDVELKKRGNATLQYAKKPYQLKFNQKISLFDLGENRKWILLANYSDYTHLRTAIAFYIEHLLNSAYPLNGQFVNLYIDNNYRGLYYLTDKVEIGKSRINLHDKNGIIVELDNLYGHLEGCVYDLYENCLVAKDFVNKDLSEKSINSFMESFNSFEKALASKDYETIKELIDIDSFARYYLISEFTVNPDAYTTSFYMYKDSDKIFAGAGWDFDASLGNKLWNTSDIDPDILHSPTESDVLRRHLKDSGSNNQYAGHISTIIYDLLDLPEFKARIKELYQETISGNIDELLDYIKSQSSYIKEAVKKDEERWKIKTNFDGEIDYLVDWVAKRYNYFEQIYGTN